jgi:quinol monooxygenase YgiN
MIIVAGALRVDPGDREVYLASCQPVVESALATDGCHEFHLSADPLDPGRVNVFERWESIAAVEAFRGAPGPGSGVRVDLLRGAEVSEYEVSSSRRL